jgi:hypothetical protein
MTQSEGPGPNEIAELWREKFGEPPAILTDAETMFRVLISLPPRSFAPPDDVREPLAIGSERFLRRRREALDNDGWIGGEDTTP